MTVVVAARTIHRVGRKDVEAVTMAADSQISDGWEKTASSYQKLWQKEERLLFGASGFVASWQAVRYACDWPHYPQAQDWEEWLVCYVRPMITSALDQAEILERRRAVINTGMSLIVATGTNLASIDPIGGVLVPMRQHTAIGSGYAEALGFLDGKKGPPWKPEDVIGAALAATKSAVGCGPPIFWATTLDYKIQEAELA